MATASPESKKRTQTLELLASFGIKLPSKTKLPDEVLEKRLMTAINASQYISSTIPNPPLDPSAFPKWDSSDPDVLMNAMQRTNPLESLNVLAARQMGKLNEFDLYANPFHDLRQTFLSISRSWAQGLECCVVQDVKKIDWAINIRVSLYCIYPIFPVY